MERSPPVFSENRRRMIGRSEASESSIFQKKQEQIWTAKQQKGLRIKEIPESRSVRNENCEDCDGVRMNFESVITSESPGPDGPGLSRYIGLYRKRCIVQSERVPLVSGKRSIMPPACVPDVLYRTERGRLHRTSGRSRIRLTA